MKKPYSVAMKKPASVAVPLSVDEVLRPRSAPTGASFRFDPGMLQLVGEACSLVRQLSSDASRRAEIVADRDRAIHTLEANRAEMKDYLERTFAERRDVLTRLQSAMDTALAEGKPEIFAAALQGLTSVVNHNPLADLAEFRAARAEGRPLEI